MEKKLTGSHGGAWDQNTHMELHEKNFNEGLAEYIVDTIKPTSLLEFGSGLGFLSKYINDHLSLNKQYCLEPNEIHGVYDNRKGPILLPLDIFNINHPQTINHKFDLVMSIEVAEHVEKDKHEKLFDFLVAHTNKWIVFSGARVGQGGHGHIAERDETEWKNEFISRGMVFREELTEQIRKASDKKNINHRQNLMVFKRPKHYLKLDKLEELLSPYLSDLLAIVLQKSKYLDGNLFYENLEDALNSMPVDNLKEKRLNLFEIMSERNNILEIGFNAGHSVLIMLIANPQANITIVDTCQHSYTEECFYYLNRLFPGRLKLLKGNSIEVMPTLQGKKFDLIHFDGGKEKTIYEDINNSIPLVLENHVLLIDDTQNIKLNSIIQNLSKQGLIEFSKYQIFSDKAASRKCKHILATFTKKPDE